MARKPTPFEGPIPGQSLTAEPKNAPWENPPQISTKEGAFEYYIKKLGKDDVQDDVLDMLDLGMPVDALTDAMLTQGIMAGIHTVDIKLLIKARLMAVVEAVAQEAGIDYVMSFEDYADKDEDARIKRQRHLAAKLSVEAAKKGEEAPLDEGGMLERDIAEIMQENPMEEAQETPEFEASETPEYEQKESMGLMSKEPV